MQYAGNTLAQARSRSVSGLAKASKRIALRSLTVEARLPLGDCHDLASHHRARR